MEPKSVVLHSIKGGSDKVYKMQLVQVGSQWIVNCQNGRRWPGAGYDFRDAPQTNSYPRSGTTTYQRALGEWNRILEEKLRAVKGYRIVSSDEGSSVTTGSTAPTVEAENVEVKERDNVGLMLLTRKYESDAESLDRNPSWCSQQKYDGERRAVRIDVSGHGVGINRNEEVIELPDSFQSDCEKICTVCLIDGEQVGPDIMAFDLLGLDGEDWRQKPMKERWLKLADILSHAQTQHIKLVETYFTKQAKSDFRVFARQKRYEGLVYKMVSARYESGRSKKAIKVKFTEDVTCMVTGINTNKNGEEKRSVAIAVPKNGILQSIGNVTIPANFDVPHSWQLVDVNYLYAYPNGGSLYQPVYKGPRTDKDKADDYSTLKFKEGLEEDDEAAA